SQLAPIVYRGCGASAFCGRARPRLTQRRVHLLQTRTGSGARRWPRSGPATGAGVPMKLRYKILSGIGVVLVAGIVAIALILSHTSPCAPPTPFATAATPMKGVVRHCYGSPDVVRYEDVAKPTPKDDELLVKVQAASVNPLDWHYLEGTPYLVRTDTGLGKP